MTQLTHCLGGEAKEPAWGWYWEHGPDSTKVPGREGCGQSAVQVGSKGDGDLANHGVCLDI